MRLCVQADLAKNAPAKRRRRLSSRDAQSSSFPYIAARVVQKAACTCETPKRPEPALENPDRRNQPTRGHPMRPVHVPSLAPSWRSRGTSAILTTCEALQLHLISKVATAGSGCAECFFELFNMNP
jgi:hypothetical protein